MPIPAASHRIASSTRFHESPVEVIELRPNVGLPAGLEGVEVVRATRAIVDARYSSQPDAVDPAGIVVYRGQVGFLNIVNPQGHSPIVRTCGCRCPPVQLDCVRRIADGKPGGVGKTRAVIGQAGPELILPTGKAKFHSQHNCSGGG